jgi:hypothetical protein
MVPMRTPRPGEGARSVRGCRVHRLIHTALLEVQALRAHPHLPAPLMWVPLLERDASAGARPGPHPIGTQRFATVSSGTAFAQVAGAILRKQARVQISDKDEVPSSRPATDGRPIGSSHEFTGGAQVDAPLRQDRGHIRQIAWTWATATSGSSISSLPSCRPRRGADPGPE